jgi:hypothetical protein
VLSGERVAELAELVWHFEEVPDVREVARILA